MLGIVYVSKAAVEFDNPALDELATRSAHRNVSLDITGLLCFEHGRFIQYIEGDREPVTALMSRIECDARHEVLSILHDEQLRVRRFPRWHMRRLARGELAQIKVERVLGDYLQVMSPVPHPDHRWQDSVWRMVETLARIHQHVAWGRATTTPAWPHGKEPSQQWHDS